MNGKIFQYLLCIKHYTQYWKYKEQDSPFSQRAPIPVAEKKKTSHTCAELECAGDSKEREEFETAAVEKKKKNGTR